MSLLDQLEIEVAERLQSFPFFADLEVHVDPAKNIVASIETKLAKLKTLVAPLVESADDLNPNIHAPYFDQINISVGVFQHPLLKGDHPTPRAICEEIHQALKGWKPDSLSNVITPGRPGIQQIADKTLNIWSTNFLTKGGLIATLTKVATPSSYNTNGGIILHTTTAGAAIYYTTDGTNPAPRNGTLFTAPFAAVSGTVIRARAFLAGYLQSDLLKVTLTSDTSAALASYRLQLYTGADWITLGSDGAPPQLTMTGTRMRFKPGTGVQLQNTDTTLYHTFTAGGSPAQFFLDPEGEA